MNPNDVSSLLRSGREYLAERGMEAPYLDAQLFMMECLGIDKMELLMRPNYVLNEEEKDCYWAMIKKRGDNIPTQYILGRCEFMSLDFCVDENVLIPRPDTEILVETVLEKANKNRIRKIIDIGTGSGAIAVSLVKYGIEKATAFDISKGALAVAKKNADLNGVADRITFVNGDALCDELDVSGYDAVVSNPPYIERGVIPKLMPEVKDHEPMNALDGGEDGLDFYRAITKAAAKGLESGGYLFYEIGYNQGSAVSGILEDNGFFDIEVIKDLSGLDRVVCGRKK